MTTIYCIKDINSSENEMFMSLEGMAKWLTKKTPIENKFNVIYPKGLYDITPGNLRKVMDNSKANCGLWPTIHIQQDFFIQIIDTEYVISEMYIND